ncbi:hypothetical protein ACX4MT_13100 [Roseomonas mucosa]
MPQTVAEWVYAARLALWWAVRALAHWLSLPAGLVVAFLLSAGDFSFFGGFVARGVVWFLIVGAARFLAPRLRPPPWRSLVTPELPPPLVQPARTEPADTSPDEAAITARLPMHLQRFLAEERAASPPG